MNFEKQLKSKKLKVTPQRLAILKELQENGHMSIDDIYEKIKRIYPYVSLATVYKNMTTLYEANILREIKAPKQKQRYELRGDHIHVMCEKCGKLEDIPISLRDLKIQSEKVSGYILYDISAILIGICSECEAKMSIQCDLHDKIDL